MKGLKISVLSFLICSNLAFAQVADYQRDYNKINEHLMLTLGSYAVGNFAVSGAGYFNAEDEYTKHFHEMNVMWNTAWRRCSLPVVWRGRKENLQKPFTGCLKILQNFHIIFV